MTLNKAANKILVSVPGIRGWGSIGTQMRIWIYGLGSEWGIFIWLIKISIFFIKLYSRPWFCSQSNLFSHMLTWFAFGPVCQTGMFVPKLLAQLFKKRLYRLFDTHLVTGIAISLRTLTFRLGTFFITTITMAWWQGRLHGGGGGVLVRTHHFLNLGDVPTQQIWEWNGPNVVFSFWFFSLFCSIF